MSVNRNKESKQAIIQREYRERKLNKLIDEEMSKNKKLTREQAIKIVKDNIRKKNSENRQILRMKKRGSKIVKKEKEPEERKEEYITENLNPLSTAEIKKIKGDLQVIKKFKTDDDKKLFNRLSYAEQKLINRMSKFNKSSIRSLVQYLQKVKQVYKKDNQVFNGSNIGLLKDKRKVLNILSNYKNPKDHIYAIINVLKAFFNNDELIKYYETIMKKFMEKNVKDIRQNKKSEKQNQNWINYDKLVKIFKQNKNKLNDNDKLLMSFIIFFPRRLQDYYKMKLHKTGKKDMNFNYLNLNKFNMPSSFQFFRSKSQNYEDTTKRIPSSLKNIIMNYVREKEVKNNQLLFPKSNGKIHNADSFSKHITKLFKDITGKNINMNLYRHIVATNLSDKNYSMNQREKIASEMGHSILKSYEYSKK
ncbi:MAG: hypothetical protein CMJ25_02305 [Phycisphaerae bacterium]|nr:hypothetical protein [Phycisphaerae bacterium]|tara:strand:- start:4478 stop:5734 length:1257 start_codon:yes stop_codon:yes gene_type:complete